MGRDAAELRECCFVVDAFGVVAGGDEKLACELGADTLELEELGGCRLNDRGDLAVEGFDLVVEGVPAPPSKPVRSIDLDNSHTLAG